MFLCRAVAESDWFKTDNKIDYFSICLCCHSPFSEKDPQNMFLMLMIMMFTDTKNAAKYGFQQVYDHSILNVFFQTPHICILLRLCSNTSNDESHILWWFLCLQTRISEHYINSWNREFVENYDSILGPCINIFFILRKK